MKIHTLRAEVLHADGHTHKQTEWMKPRVAFRNFKNAHKMDSRFTNNTNNIWDFVKLRIKVTIFCIIQRATERFIMSEVFWCST